MRWRLLLFLMSSLAARAAELPVPLDEQTLLLARFDQSLAADFAAGEAEPEGHAPLVDARFGSGVLLARGLSLSVDGVRLPFKALAWPVEDNLDPSAGTIEFWFQPRFSEWDEANQRYLHYLFDARRGTSAGIALLIIRTPEGQTLQFSEQGPEAGDVTLSVDVGDWEAGQWKRITLTWQGRHRRLWLDDTLAAESETAPEQLQVLAPEIRFGSVPWNAHFADGILDELRISKVVRDVR